MHFGTGVKCFAALAICAAATARPADALLIVQSDSFTFNGVPGVANVGFQEFDPALGTLDSVSVQITGTFSVTTFVAPGQSFVPIVQLDAVQAGPRGFSFGPEAQFFFPVVFDPGPPVSSGHIETVATGFSIDFTFTAATDLVGFAPANATATAATVVPPTAAGQRGDFIAFFPPGPIGINQTLVLSPNFSPNSAFSGGGSVILTYDYTPLQVEMPAPPTAPLLALGLAALALYRRR